MIFSPKAASLSLAIVIVLGYSSLATVAASSSKTRKASKLRPLVNHPPVRRLQQNTMHPILAEFSNQFRCPYAQEWLLKGPHKAAIDLGLMTPEKIDAALKNGKGNHFSGRRRVQEMAAMGSCSFNNQWSGPSCVEFRGEGWIEGVSMIDRCNFESDSTFAEGQGCPTPSTLAGWCVKEASGSDRGNAFEASSMMKTGMSPDCDSNKMACENFIGGTWEGAGSCSDGAVTDGGGDTDYTNMKPPSSMGDGTCLLAPGAMGAAHQAGFSNGYSATCPGTPAEGSPYMWPVAWSADIDTQALQFGVDEVLYHSKGRVFYRLDKNWKRSDTTYTMGVLRSVGQGPCDDINEEAMNVDGVAKACNQNDDFANGDPLKTMIHRGSKMYFITWKTGADVKVGETDPSLIDDCNYLDLAVIGNIRPDWFLDDRGDDTDVQYIGDQHVYYASEDPRLVKQWRKKDFASQYFTMSVTGNPRSKKLVLQNATVTEEDKVHWPLILNIPGEGFGDDMLQVYQDHSLLTDENDDLFLLIENLEASGGSCPLIVGDGSFGPPTTEVSVPSNLEVDPNSWYSNVYTFSPVWEPPMVEKDRTSDIVDKDSKVVAVTEKDRARVESCYDPSSKSVELSVQWQNIDVIPAENGSQLPWMALGYRINEMCAMNPPDGSESKIVVVSQMPTESFPKAYAGSLIAGAKGLSPTTMGTIYSSLRPLESTTGYSDVSVSAPMLSSNSDIQIARSSNPTSVTLSFTQQFDEKPDVMHLMYAIGMSPQLGLHTSRGCFEVVEFPTCSGEGEEPKEGELASSSSMLSTAVIGVAAVVSSIFLAM